MRWSLGSLVLVISRLTGESGGGLFKHLPDRGELGRVLVVVEASVHCDSLTQYTWLSVHWSIHITANTPPIHSQADTQIYQHTTDRQPVSRLSELKSQQTAASLPIHNGRKSRLSKPWSQQTAASPYQHHCRQSRISQLLLPPVCPPDKYSSATASQKL